MADLRESDFDNRWEGYDSRDHEGWSLEIESDRFHDQAPAVVSLCFETWERNMVDDGPTLLNVNEGIATASPDQARAMAAALLRIADHVEVLNESRALEGSRDPRGEVEKP